MDQRQQFIKGFIDKAKTQNMPAQQIDSNLTLALQDYDKQYGQKVLPQLNPVMQAVGGGLGAVGGATLGVAGGALVPGADLTGVPEAAGGYAGAVGGAALGSASGNAVADNLRKKMGDTTINNADTLKNSIDAGKWGGGAEAVGIPAAKGLGMIAHPIQPFIEMVDKKLASSAKTVDFAKLLQSYRSDVLPKLEQSGFGTLARDAANKMEQDVRIAVSAFKTHVPAGAEMPSGTDVSSMELPIAQANQLKRTITSKLGDYYGFDSGKPNIEAAKQFGSLLREKVAALEPGVKLPNKVASSLYQVPDLLGGLTHVLPPQGARAIQSVGSLPFDIAQKVIPAGGGYLNQAIPRLLQLLGSPSPQ